MLKVDAGEFDAVAVVVGVAAAVVAVAVCFEASFEEVDAALVVVVGPLAAHVVVCCE
jgi:hypothetical protein